MTGNGGWGSTTAIEKARFDTPAPRRGEKSPRIHFLNRDPGVKERIAALVAKLKRTEPTKH